jgi:hypothetical protein
MYIANWGCRSNLYSCAVNFSSNPDIHQEIQNSAATTGLEEINAAFFFCSSGQVPEQKYIHFFELKAQAANTIFLFADSKPRVQSPHRPRKLISLPNTRMS